MKIAVYTIVDTPAASGAGARDKRTTKKGANSMSTKRKTKRTPARRRVVRKKAVRKNPARKSVSLRKKARSKTSTSRHRPVVYKVAGKWKRPEKAKYKMRVNKRKRKIRRNPKFKLKSLISQQYLMQVATIGGGIAAGFFAMPVLNAVAPASLKTPQARRFYGLAHVLLGGLVAGFAKGKNAKQFGIVIAGTGAYDLIAQNIVALGLPSLPDQNPLVSQYLPGSGSGEAEMTSGASRMVQAYGANYSTPAPAGYMGANYTVPQLPVSPVAQSGMGASYGAPGMSTQGLHSDSPFEGIEGWE